MPANFIHLGLIAQLFPNARIIHCSRNPLDTGLSIYFQRFLENISYAFDLENIAHYYLQYERLMQHWHAVLDIPILTVSYEDLVADQEKVSRKLVDFCGLEWDDRCLHFHRTGRTVSTASFDQVRKTMYSSSVGRWKHYEKHLGPLLQILGQEQCSFTP
jgi:hypothetical protein